MGSAYCECPDGFDIGDDDQTCHDINEVDSDYDSGLEIHYTEFYRSLLISSSFFSVWMTTGFVRRFA